MKGSALELLDCSINSFKKIIFGSSLCSDWGRCCRFNDIQTCVLIEKTQNWRNMYNQLNKYKHRIHSGCHRGHLVLEQDHFQNIWREKLRLRFLNYGDKKAGVSHSSMTSFKCFEQMLRNVFPFRKIIVFDEFTVDQRETRLMAKKPCRAICSNSFSINIVSAFLVCLTLGMELNSGIVQVSWNQV